MPACLFLLLSFPATAQDWPRFRGPNGSGLASPTTLPTQWTTKDYLWKVPLPGPGHTTPVRWKDRLFITSCDPESAKRIVLCLNASDGSLLWKREFPSLAYRQHADNSYASSTPAVDEHRLYLTWTTPDECALLALDHDGKDVWKLNLGRYTSQHGSGVSPILFEGLVILTNDQEGLESFIIAVECETGQVRWKTPRKSSSMAAST
ncbi:MAG: PQQ-binding-like beta-propeller repeat protein, partial [Bacillota bacterium]